MESSKMGSIELIIGPMFSGKTTLHNKKINKLRGEKKKVCVIKHPYNTRYDKKKKIYTHDGSFVEATVVSDTVKTLDFTGYDAVTINEGHFFNKEKGLADFFQELADGKGLTVIIAGLMSNFKREKFEGNFMNDLIAKADAVTSLKARCSTENCQRPAVFTKKITGDEEKVIDLGGSEKYTPCCRKCYLK
jgi:thymidine kinase